MWQPSLPRAVACLRRCWSRLLSCSQWQVIVNRSERIKDCRGCSHRSQGSLPAPSLPRHAQALLIWRIKSKKKTVGRNENLCFLSIFNTMLAWNWWQFYSLFVAINHWWLRLFTFGAEWQVVVNRIVQKRQCSGTVIISGVTTLFAIIHWHWVFWCRGRRSGY